MRRHIILISIIAFLALISLVSCSNEWGNNVYYGGIGGSVKDSDTSSVVSGVQVYLYTSESDRDRAYALWEENGGKYSDNSCLYKASTDSNGKWSVPKVIWTSKKGAWGDDYDHIPVWITYFSEDYGCWKEQKIELVSGTSNSNAVETKRSKVKTTSTLTVYFREGNKNVSDTINFTVSYDDGYTVKENEESTSNGQYSIDLSYVKNNEGVKVTFSDIKASNGCWEDAPEFEVVVDQSSMETEVPMTRTKYDLGSSGLSGTVTATRRFVMETDESKTVKRSLNGLKITASVNGNEYYVLTGDGNYDGEYARSFSVSFSDLAINEKVEKNTPTTVMIKVYQNGSDTPLVEHKLDLDGNYSGKNNISIAIPDSAASDWV